MPGSFEEDPAIDDTIPSGNHPLDYEEMRRGTPPPWSGFPAPAFAPLDADKVVEAVRTLMSREFKVRIAIEDADTGTLLWWVRPDVRARMGDTIKLEVPIRLEAN